MRGVFVDQAELARALGDDIGFEHLAHQAQRFGFRRRGHDGLLGRGVDNIRQCA